MWSVKRLTAVSPDSLKKTFTFDCVNCSTTVEINSSSIVGKAFTWHEEFDEKTYEEIKSFYGMNVVGKTPDGSFP